MYYAVSIAIGYAYTSDISKEGYENLMIEADKKMYEKDGEKLYAIAVIAQRITFVPKRREQPQEQAEQSE